MSTYNIHDGPSFDRMIDSLKYARVIHGDISVRFHTDQAEFSAVITALAFVHDSSRHVNFEAQLHGGARIVGEYNTRSRTGTCKIVS